jgi:uncharacterized protein YoxC
LDRDNSEYLFGEREGERGKTNRINKKMADQFTKADEILKQIREIAASLVELGIKRKNLVKKVKKQVSYFSKKSDSTVYRLLFNKSLFKILENATTTLEKKLSLLKGDQQEKIKVRPRKLIAA